MLMKRFSFHLHIHFAHLLEERLRLRLAPLGLHPRQARVLDTLDVMGTASQVQLARELGLTAASMSTMTSRLLAAELIERKVDEQELRSNVLKLSKHGRRLLKKIHGHWQAVDLEISEVIGEEESASLAEQILKLRNAFGGKTPGLSDSD